MDVEREILELKRRVGDLEGTLNVVTGQMGRLHPEIKDLNDTTRIRFDGLEGIMERLFSRFETMNTQVWALRDDIPALLVEALRKSRQRND